MNLEGDRRQILSSIHKKSLILYVLGQCNNFFPDGKSVNYNDLESPVSTTIDRLQYCFSKIITPYYKRDGLPYFNHLHGDHYSMFLYLLSNTCYKQSGNEDIAAKLFLLNKTLFGIDAYYKIELPEIFMFIHPVGTILGNATYKNNFVVYQGVTIGATTDWVYASFSESTILYSNCSIIGNCKLGSNFVLAANASLVNCVIPANKIVVGNYPDHRILENKNNLISKYFSI